MTSSGERYAGWPLIIGIVVAVLALTAGPALAALTFSGTSISGDGAVVIDSPSTISIGTSAATTINIGNGSSTVSLVGDITTGNGAPAQFQDFWGTGFTPSLNSSYSLTFPFSPMMAEEHWAEINQSAYDSNDQMETFSFLSHVVGNGAGTSGESLSNGVWWTSGADPDDSTALYNFFIDESGATTVDLFSLENNPQIGNASHVTNVHGIEAQGAVYGGSVVTNLWGFHVINPNVQGGSTLTNLVGLKVDDLTQGTNNYAIETGLGKVNFGDVVQIATSTFSGLPTCNSSEEGTQHPVTDAATSTLGATVTGSGSNHVLAYCDGTNWTVMAR